jgi:hypothetical protein
MDKILSYQLSDLVSGNGIESQARIVSQLQIGTLANIRSGPILCMSLIFVLFVTLHG